MDQNLESNDLENLIIKDKNYYRKRRIKILSITIPIILVTAIVIALIILLMPEPDNKIICYYNIINANENIVLININNDIDYNLIINDTNYGKKNTHIFSRTGKYKVIFDFIDKLNSLEGFFEENKYLIEADLSKLRSDEITSMSNLFKSCYNLKKVYFDNKSPNLENINNMFYNCNSLDTIHLNFDTSKIVKMDNMFNQCKSLINLDISNFSLISVVNASSMFQDCINLKEIKFNNNTITNNLEDMNSMFYGCNSLEYINANIFKVNKVTNLSYTFANCNNLKELNLSNFIIENVKELSGTFMNCLSLETIDLTHYDTSKVTKMENMFNNCRSLKKLDISNFNLENVINLESMFQDCIDLTEIIFNNDTRTNNLEYMNSMFLNCYSLNSINTQIFKDDKNLIHYIYLFFKLEKNKKVNKNFIENRLIKEPLNYRNIFTILRYIDNLDEKINTNKICTNCFCKKNEKVCSLNCNCHFPMNIILKNSYDMYKKKSKREYYTYQIGEENIENNKNILNIKPKNHLELFKLSEKNYIRGMRINKTFHYFNK